MPQSRRFRALEKRVDALRSHFLPRFSPIGQYTPRQYDLTSAYVLLVHAEIESYLEDRAREVALRAQVSWKRHGRHSRVIKRLFHFHNRTDRPWKRFEKRRETIQACLNSYFSLINNNHGIKEDNVCKMLFPIGIAYAHLDVLWLSSLKSFGT